MVSCEAIVGDQSQCEARCEADLEWLEIESLEACVACLESNDCDAIRERACEIDCDPSYL